MGCQLVVEKWWGNFEVLTLENDYLTVCLMPGRGGEFHQITSKKRGLEFFHTERPDIADFHPVTPETPLTADQNVAFSSFYTMFPNGGPEQVYKSYKYPFHGDSRLTAWSYRVIEQSDLAIELELKAASPNLPFTLTRLVRLEADARQLSFTDTLGNESQTDSQSLPYVYGFHPYFGYPLLDEGTQLRVGQRVVHEMPPRAEPGGVLYSLESGTDSQVEISNSKLGTTLRLHFEPDFLKFVWVWVSNQPDRNVYVASLLPCTAPSTLKKGVVSAVEEGTACWLAPGETRTTRWQVEIEG